MKVEEDALSRSVAAPGCAEECRNDEDYEGKSPPNQCTGDDAVV